MTIGQVSLATQLGLKGSFCATKADGVTGRVKYSHLGPG
jgi:hypothetical protein